MKKYLPDIKNINPVQQGLFIVLMITLASLSCLVFNQKSMTAWNLIISPILLYCFYNPVIGIFQQKLLQYAVSSFFILLTIAVFTCISGNIVSDFSFKQVSELHYIAGLILLFYVLLYFLCLVFKGILSLLNEIDN
ncbi:MAG TPA: hypothetical protein PLX60_00385 [Chitinophagales bacterium]|jgi:hypothetical protein|nr:hypothetical protein [Chitinophagales bacterium]HOY40282.1 hypothetical protein [Chitinophagales bacterium]